MDWREKKEEEKKKIKEWKKTEHCAFILEELKKKSEKKDIILPF